MQGANCKLQSAKCKVQSAKCDFAGTPAEELDWLLQVTSYKSQVTSYKLQVTSYKLQARPRRSSTGCSAAPRASCSATRRSERSRSRAARRRCDRLAHFVDRRFVLMTSSRIRAEFIAAIPRRAQALDRLERLLATLGGVCACVDVSDYSRDIAEI